MLREEGSHGHPAAFAQHVAAARVIMVKFEVHHPRRVDRRGYRVDGAMRQHVHIADAVRVQSGHRAARRRPEADDGRSQPPAILTGQAGEFQGVQDRAVTGHLVVLVKDMQAERAVSGPVVHRLERDQGEPPVDAQLRDLRVLNTMRPAPQDLARSHALEVGCLRLWEQDDGAIREELGAGPEPGDALREVLVGDAERLAVTAL